MAEWFTANSTVDEILYNDRVCKKIGYFYPKVFADNIKAPFRKMKIKNILKLGKAAVKKPFHGEELIECANIILERREKGSFVSIPVWKDKENTGERGINTFPSGKQKGLTVRDYLCRRRLRSGGQLYRGSPGGKRTE